MKPYPHIAVFGTGSDVGKSIVAAALCRILADRGIRVAPFKAQNMSNNSGVTPEGLEMGRAQIVQAQAARTVPHTDMNPVLLKPTGEKKSQVVLNGRVSGDHTAMEYHDSKSYYFDQACRAFDRLSTAYDMIVLEGAGSCAEVNLMPSDIVNFKMAVHADARVILVADIHRGGVFAQIVGTMACLPEEYQARIDGFIINRFRGDVHLFQDGVEWIEQMTGKPVFGVLPWYSDFKIDAEDSVELEQVAGLSELPPGGPAIGIVRLPHISNFTDFHPLSDIPGLRTAFVDKAVDLTRFNAVIIPGSKNTRDDLHWLEKTGLGQKIQQYADQGGYVIGICGGYQILGRQVEDPNGLEGLPGISSGLGLLEVNTCLAAPKTTTLSEFEYMGHRSAGYEIHMGQSQPIGTARPFLSIRSRNGTPCDLTDGCISANGRIFGTYIHGFFDSPLVTAALLNTMGIRNLTIPATTAAMKKELDYDRLKNHFQAHVTLPF